MIFSNGMSLVEAYDEFILDRQVATSPETVKSYMFNLGRRFLPWAEANGTTRLKEVDRGAVRRYMAFLASQGLASSTRETCGKCLKAFMNWTYEEKYISEPINFRKLIPRPRKKEPQVISPENFAKFVEAAGIRGKAILLLMADSGLRRREVCGLKWDHLDFEGRRIRVVDGKAKEGVAYFGLVAALALLEWSQYLGRRKNAPVFVSSRDLTSPSSRSDSPPSSFGCQMRSGSSCHLMGCAGSLPLRPIATVRAHLICKK